MRTVLVCVAVTGSLLAIGTPARAFTDCVVGPGCPAAADDAYTTAFNVKLSVAAPGVLANDSGPSTTDPNGPTTVDVADSDTTSWNGADVAIHSNGSFTYTPDPTNPFTGIDSFDYYIQDSQGDTDFATAYITVTPTVRDDSYKAHINQTLKVGPPGIFANDLGVDPTSVTFDVRSAHNGPVDVANDGSFTYTPPHNFSGTDTFAYQVFDLDLDIQYGATARILVANAPSAPTSVHAVAAVPSATVSWTAPASNGSPITSYTVTASPGGKTLTVPGTQTHATFARLAKGTYTFKVRAANAAGTGPWSASSASTLVAVLSNFTYTAHYTDSQYAFMIKTAAHFHLAVQDVPKTGVSVVAFILKISNHPPTKPIVNVHNVGNHVISTTYSRTDNNNTMMPVAHYIVQDGDNTLYVGGLLMEYFAAVEGVS